MTITPRRRGSARRRPGTPRTLAWAMTAGLVLAACGSAVPTPSPVSPDPVPSDAPMSSTPGSPDGVLAIDEPAYLAGSTLAMPIGDAGSDWSVPAQLPIMPNGQAARRVAFLPATCVGVDMTIAVDPPPEDAWEAALRDDGEQRRFSLASWPAAQVPECAHGQGRTYLEVAYVPFGPSGAIHVVASVRNPSDALTTIGVVPMFTSADAGQPAFASDGFVALSPASGPKKPRGAAPRELMATTFTRTTLPDGSTPSHWGFSLTGCGPIGGTDLAITVRIGDAAPVEVGTCSDGSFSSSMAALPIPPDGTRYAILASGGTTKSQVRVSSFQWRGERP